MLMSGGVHKGGVHALTFHCSSNGVKLTILAMKSSYIMKKNSCTDVVATPPPFGKTCPGPALGNYLNIYKITFSIKDKVG